MCGVFGISNFVKYDLGERFGFENDGIIPHEFKATTFRPHSLIPTVSREDKNVFKMRHWSLIPPWIRDMHDLKYPTFNARSETLDIKPTFKDAWRHGNRCLIIATEFYEYRDNGKGNKKTPFKFSLFNDEPFAIAGIFQAWNDIVTATIVTTEPNYDSKDIHDRLPAVLAREDEEKWLSQQTPRTVAHELLILYPDGEFKISEVESPFTK